jgi:hypothetical protein
MSRKAFAAAVLTAAVSAGAAYAGNGAAPAGTKYISKRYSYEIRLRGKYTMTQASAQWQGVFPFGDSGQVDLIVANNQDHKFIVAAKPVPPGMSLSRWEAFVVRVQRQACSRLRDFRASSLGGVPAREFVNSCPSGWEVITLAAVHQGRGYLLEYLSSNAASGRRIYEAGRRAFHFTQK